MKFSFSGRHLIPLDAPPIPRVQSPSDEPGLAITIHFTRFSFKGIVGNF
jgi:hypothetical protein